MVKNLKNEQAQNLVKMQELQNQLAVAQKQQESAKIMTTANAANNTFKTEQLQKNFKLLKNIEHNLNAFIGNANKKTDSQLEELGKLRASMTDMSSTATATGKLDIFYFLLLQRTQLNSSIQFSLTNPNQIFNFLPLAFYPLIFISNRLFFARVPMDLQIFVFYPCL